MKATPLWHAILFFFFFSIEMKYLKADHGLKKCKIGNSNVKSIPGFKIQSVRFFKNVYDISFNFMFKI